MPHQQVPDHRSSSGRPLNLCAAWHGHLLSVCELAFGFPFAAPKQLLMLCACPANRDKRPCSLITNGFYRSTNRMNTVFHNTKSKMTDSDFVRLKTNAIILNT